MSPEVLLHLLPFAHGEASEPYVVLALVLAGVFASVLAGIYAARYVLQQDRWAHLAVGFSAGALLFLFFDLLKESASLGQGLVRSPLLMAGLLLAFALGALFIPALGRDPGAGRLAWLWALGIAAHGAGEGWIIGTEAASAELAPLGMASFLLHKGLEGFTIPVMAAWALPRRTRWGAAGAIAGVAALAGLAGLFVGSSQAPLLFFAAGAGAAGFVVLRLGALTGRPGLGQAAAMVLGLVAVYAAGVLHEIG